MLNNKQTINPTTEFTNSNNPHVLKVSFIEIPSVCWNNRNPPSYIKVIVLLPQAIASNISTGLTLKLLNIGCIIPATVIAETAPCPVHKSDNNSEYPS